MIYVGLKRNIYNMTSIFTHILVFFKYEEHISEKVECLIIDIFCSHFSNLKKTSLNFSRACLTSKY